MKPTKKDQKKFDLDLSYGEIREDKVRDMLEGKKIEVKSERGMWMKTGNICIEYESWNKPSGIRATESDYWFHNLCVGDNEFCTLVFKTDVLRTIVDKLDTFKTVSGGDHNASKMFLVNLQKLFSSDVIKAFKDSEDGKENGKNEKTLDSSSQEVYNKLSANKFKSESGHWYTQEGEPMYTIVGANGKERNTTLRDARKENLVPSVTTILSMIAKPQLENWKINQALNSALTLEKDSLETIEEFAYRCKQDSKRIGQEAAEKGTKIHAMIERGFLGEEKTETYCVIQNYLDEMFPDEEWIAEASFCADLGYGGKIDLYSKSGIFVDFKTKDNLEGKDPSKLVYDEHGMQLSAYAQGCGFDDVERVSIFVDREDTELIACHVWDKESQTKHREMFNSILNYWKLVKNYAPEKV